MTKTTTMTRIYIIDDTKGSPIALAEAISQAEALRLYTESLGLSAHVASALATVQLRDLPVLSRRVAGADTQTLPIYLGDAG